MQHFDSRSLSLQVRFHCLKMGKRLHKIWLISLTACSTSTSSRCPVHSNTFCFSSLHVVRRFNKHRPWFSISDFNRRFVCFERQYLRVYRRRYRTGGRLEKEQKRCRRIVGELRTHWMRLGCKWTRTRNTCSWSAMWLIVGLDATLYHPMNSSEGNTCLSAIHAFSDHLGWLYKVDAHTGLS